MQPSLATTPGAESLRTTTNRVNAQHSTGPRTDAGKQRSSLNALRHGLTAASPVLPSEDRAAYEQHRRQFFDEYQPATETETQLVNELVDTSWRLNRIPLLEAALLTEADRMRARRDPLTLISDTTRTLAALGLHGQRLSRQFNKTLQTLRGLQAERRDREQRELKDAASMLEMHKHQGLPWTPSSDAGFVFSKDQVEGASECAMRQSGASDLASVKFEISQAGPTPY